MKQGCPLIPLFSIHKMGKFLNTSDHGAMIALQTTKIFHSEWADDVTLTTNTAHHLQLQLDRFNTNMMTTYSHCGSANTVACFWNSLLTSYNALLTKINEADLLLAHRKGS